MSISRYFYDHTSEVVCGNNQLLLFNKRPRDEKSRPAGSFQCFQTFFLSEWISCEGDELSSNCNNGADSPVGHEIKTCSALLRYSSVSLCPVFPGLVEVNVTVGQLRVLLMLCRCSAVGGQTRTKNAGVGCFVLSGSGVFKAWEARPPPNTILTLRMLCLTSWTHFWVNAGLPDVFLMFGSKYIKKDNSSFARQMLSIWKPIDFLLFS